MNDWTEKDGISNSSDEYKNIVNAVDNLIRESAHMLIAGQTQKVARLIVSQLTRKWDMPPQPILFGIDMGAPEGDKGFPSPCLDETENTADDRSLEAWGKVILKSREWL